MTTVVVIPTYNEAEGIEIALDAVLRAEPGADVLVVDDNSPDGTAALVAAHPAFGRQVHLLNRAEKDGLGAAYRAGFAWALDHDYDVIVQMDADLSHPPARIPALIAALDGADIAIGSRYVDGGGVDNWSRSRRLISWAGNTYVRAVLGLHVRDATAGFRAFRRESLVRLDVLGSQSNGYSFQIENTWRAGQQGLTTVEVPITFTDRTTGQSKMSAGIVREAIALALVWRWRQVRAQILTFLAVGGVGYVVDVAGFNLLRAQPFFAGHDPAWAKIVAVVLATVVTYVGNRALTWRDTDRGDRRREIALFALFNAIGLGFSVVTLFVSHHLMGLTSGLADNISANVIGIGLGTLFRFWSYRRFVFGSAPAAPREPVRAGR